MANIAFIFREGIFGAELREKPLGGISTSIIMLSEAFVRKGHSVTVYCESECEDYYEGVCYAPLETLRNARPDLVVANNSANDLWLARTGIPVVWQHNRTSFSRMVKRGEILALFFKRPHLVVLSNDAFQKTPRFIPYRKIHTIPHAIEPMFLMPSSGNIDSRAKQVFFASRASRNLAWVIDVWKKYIHPQLPEARFLVCTPPGSAFSYEVDDLAKYNIIYKGSLAKNALADLINSSKVLVYPGHVNETGCQVALQAIGLGVPIVTCGHGSLKDLVQSGVNGYVEEEPEAYAGRVVDLLTNQQLWLRFHQEMLNHSWRKDYDARAEDWLGAFGIK